MEPLDVLRMQPGFLGGLRFATAWAEEEFQPYVIASKIQETEALIGLLASPS